jgi:hypothetical protein
MDAGLTMILIAGGWIGLSTAAMGINMMVYNVLTGIGISVGVVTVKQIFVPKWEREYKAISKNHKNL